MRELHTAAKVKKAEDAGERREVTFKHDGTEVTFLAPDETQMALLVTAMNGAVDGIEQVSTIIATFYEIATPATARHFRGRLFDSEDSFDVAGEGGILDILSLVMEETTDRPTKQPSDYMPPQQATGSTSTGKRRRAASTSSTSRPRASATTSTSG